MATAEQLAQSMLLTGEGVHCLLWEDQEDLVRALVILRAVMYDSVILPLLLSSVEQTVVDLRKILEMKPIEENDSESYITFTPTRKEILFLFLQQATSDTIGPWLNGWRSALAKAPGSLLIIRNADFTEIQRKAPDLASFIGPKIYDTASMLSIWSQEISKRIDKNLPKDFLQIMKNLPGKHPSTNEIAAWITNHTTMNE